MRRLALLTTLLVLTPVAAQASEPSGGTALPVQGGSSYGEDPGVNGLAAQPRLTTFRLSSKTLTAKLRFRFRAKSAVRGVRVSLIPASGGSAARTYRRGTLRPGRTYALTLRSRGLASGTYRVQIGASRLVAANVASSLTVKVPAPRVAPEPAPAPKPTKQPAPAVGDHVFPVQGAYTFGGAGSRFGAGRTGHTHQGQDVAAAEGTPLVAPHAATVKANRYQASGAGYYVVLDSTGEDRDYVFMHLKARSPLTEGQAVRAGQLLGQVGNTGASEGAHLHFEIWTGGGWYTGGKPVDPLPFLKAWAGVS